MVRGSAVFSAIDALAFLHSLSSACLPFLFTALIYRILFLLIFSVLYFSSLPTMLNRGVRNEAVLGSKPGWGVKTWQGCACKWHGI
ncbi:hypothetical protein HOY80DRAFT_954878 [Tuber brumale]|nr:hypothetical protein HOY80DRAFT_954878 [Tuber brumale]